MTPDAITRTPYTPTTNLTTAPNTPAPVPTPQTSPSPLVAQVSGEKYVTTALSGSSGLRLAAQRLTRSRELLQTALEPHSSADKTSAAPPINKTTSAPATTSPTGLSSIPGYALGLEAIKFWWSRHPLRLAATLLATTANATIKPVAQRNPVALVAGAFVIGGLIAWARPWRLVLKPILIAGVMPQIASALLNHLSASAKKNANNTKH